MSDEAKFDDGGSAYPNDMDCEFSLDRFGMRLLDWFAGQLAPQLMVLGLQSSITYDPEHTARVAYSQAAAMVAEKRRREAGGT